MRKLLLIFMYLYTTCVQGQSLKAFRQQLKDSRQVLFVKTASPSSIQGEMFLYERKTSKSRWKRISSFPIVVGRAGLAADPVATFPTNTIQSKKEGDGKSPAGLFKLGAIFSYHSLPDLKMPFVQVDTNFYCIDDVASAYYNQPLLADTASMPFNSFEYMRRKDDLYEYGIWVLYNSTPVVPGDGSCIFLHVWHNENSGTSGCTAMSKENILNLIHWVDQEKNPLLLQVVKK